MNSVRQLVHGEKILVDALGVAGYERGMKALIQVRDLKKYFGNVKAVDGISFDIETDCCFGLLGPNGAGKTTTIEMMEGILAPSSGSALFKGRPIDRHFREKVGIQFQHTALPDFITVGEMLKLFSSLYKEHRPLSEVVDICSLGDLLDRDTRKLSGGQRQRLLLGIAIINRPELVFLDEPTTGLDPQSRRNFWELIGRIRAENTTVIMTTHYMEEAQQLCDRIAIVDNGKIIADDTPAQLLQENFDGVFLRLPRPEVVPAIIADSWDQRNGSLETVSQNVEQTMRELMAQNVPLEGLSIREPNLDDLFLKLTGAHLRN